MRLAADERFAEHKAAIAIDVLDTAEQNSAPAAHGSTQSDLAMDTLATWEEQLQAKEEILQATAVALQALQQKVKPPSGICLRLSPVRRSHEGAVLLSTIPRALNFQQQKLIETSCKRCSKTSAPNCRK